LVASWFQETTGLNEPLRAVAELLVARITITIFVTSMTINDPAAKLSCRFAQDCPSHNRSSGLCLALILLLFLLIMREHTNTMIRICM